MLDEHEWKGVLQVARDGTFSLAAQHLFISQPSLSQCVKKLEQALGAELFDRSQTPVALTEAGRIYVAKAQEIERLRRELIAELAELSGLESGSVAIGSSHTRTACFLRKPLVEYHRRFPSIRLSVQERPVRDLKVALLQGEIDFALIYEELLEKQLASLPLLEEKILLAVPSGHPLARKLEGGQPLPWPRLSFAALAEEPFIALQPGRGMAQTFAELCERTGVRPPIVFEANSILDAAQLAAEGMGLTLVTDMLALSWRERGRLIYFELTEELPARRLVAAFGAHRRLSLAAQKFIELLQEMSPVSGHKA